MRQKTNLEGSYGLIKLIQIIIPILLLSITRTYADEISPPDFTPGEGFKIGQSGFRLGGYGSVIFKDTNHLPSQLGIGDLSLIVHWDGEGKLRFFSEIDLEDPINITQGKGIDDKGGYLSLERAYGDYLYTDKMNFRAGKFLTPVGRWNLIHAAPLVWTTSRPLTTYKAFPTNVTGIMAYGTIPILDYGLDYSVYSAVGDDWHTSPNIEPFEEAIGTHLSLSTKLGEFGVSYANFEQTDSIGERKNLLGFDYIWEKNHYEISMEAVYRFSDKGGIYDEKGIFVQGVVPISEKFFGISRYELYDQAGYTATTNLLLVGAAFRLTPAVLLKAEYSLSNHNHANVPDGLFASFSILY